MSVVENASAQADALKSVAHTRGKTSRRDEALSRYLAAEAKHARRMAEGEDSRREQQKPKTRPRGSA